MEWKEATFATLVAMALLFLIATVGQAQLFSSGAATDQRRLEQLVRDVRVSTIDKESKAKYRQMRSKVGRAFWESCFRQRILDKELLPNLVSTGSACGDRPSDDVWLDSEELKLWQGACSYTSPEGSEVLALVNLAGNEQSVLFCFDSRNWNNYGTRGVLVAWSQGATEYIKAEAAKGRYSITDQEWKDPAAKVIGKKAPFDKTLQEAECSGFVDPSAPVKDDIDYNAVFKKKDRSWTLKAVNKRKSADESVSETVITMRYTVKEHTDSQVILACQELDGEGKAKGNSTTERSIDLSDMSEGKPTQARRVKDSGQEIEAAGRKWKVEKWASDWRERRNTYWMSTEISGLVVRAEVEKGDYLTTIELTEFKEGE